MGAMLANPHNPYYSYRPFVIRARCYCYDSVTVLTKNLYGKFKVASCYSCSLVPRSSRVPARKRVWNLSQDFLALLSQHVRKRVSQSERRLRNSHVTSMRTGTPLGSNSNCQVYMLALESACTPKAHDKRSKLRKIRHCADSAMPRNPAKIPDQAHVSVWERDYYSC